MSTPVDATPLEKKKDRMRQTLLPSLQLIWTVTETLISCCIYKGLYYPVMQVLHYKDPYEPISTMECHTGFESVAYFAIVMM